MVFYSLERGHPVVGKKRIVRYGGEQQPQAQHDYGQVVGLLRFGDAILAKSLDVRERRGHARLGRRAKSPRGLFVLARFAPAGCGRRRGGLVEMVDFKRRRQRRAQFVVGRYARIVADEKPQGRVESDYDERRYDVQQQRYDYVTVVDVDDYVFVFAVGVERFGAVAAGRVATVPRQIGPVGRLGSCRSRHFGRYILALVEYQLGRTNHQQRHVADDGNSFGKTVREEHFTFYGLLYGVQSVHGQYERKKHAKRIDAAHDVVGEVAGDSAQIVQGRNWVVEHDVVVEKYDYRKEKVRYGEQQQVPVEFTVEQWLLHEHANAHEIADDAEKHRAQVDVRHDLIYAIVYCVVLIGIEDWTVELLVGIGGQRGR